MLDEDEAKWTNNLEQVKSNASHVKSQLEALLKVQTEDIQSLLKQGVVVQVPKIIITPAGPTKSFIFRKLPMWGSDPRPERVNFEWPSLDGLSDQTTLKSLEFKKVRGDMISSVRCTLSNGETSGPIE